MTDKPRTESLGEKFHQFTAASPLSITSLSDKFYGAMVAILVTTGSYTAMTPATKSPDADTGEILKAVVGGISAFTGIGAGGYAAIGMAAARAHRKKNNTPKV